MNTTTVFELQRGRKTIYGMAEADGTVTVMVDCDQINGDGMVKFSIPAALAEKVFNPERREHIQDIAPNLRKEWREIFISGTTPAEYDVLRGDLPKTRAAFLKKYQPLGYVFEE